MATIIEREAVVGPDGSITITTAGLTPGQRVKVTVEAEELTSRAGRHVIDIVQSLPGHRQFKTAEEVDEYIREERDSWDR